jgi:transcriptional regulator with XRE-family HTH domain
MTGAELAAFRRGLGLSKSAFAKHLGLTPRTVAKYETALRVPKLIALVCQLPLPLWLDKPPPRLRQRRKSVRRERGADGRFAAKNAPETIADPG